MAKFWQGVLILSGMIIGVGMFAIPYAFAKSGFLLGTIELIVLAVVVLALHRIYGEVVLYTPELHRLPGYIRLYMGRRAAAAAFFSALFGITGTLLAYIILGGVFLNQLARYFWSGSTELFWAVATAFAAAAITLLPLKGETLVNGILTALLIGFILILSAFFLPDVTGANLAGFNAKEIFLPYGVLLFALSGGVVIPDLITYMGRDPALVRRAITAGSSIPALVYFFFAFAIVGALGAGVSEETIRSIATINGATLASLGAIIGFLSVFTSLVVLGASFQALLRLDLGAGRRIAWLIASFVPLALYFLGFQNFIAVIGAVGAIGFGIDALLIIAAYFKVLRAREGMPPRGSFFLKFGPIVLLVIGGILWELYRFAGNI